MSKEIPSDTSIRWIGKQFRHHIFKLIYIGQSNENMSEEKEEKQYFTKSLIKIFLVEKENCTSKNDICCFCLFVVDIFEYYIFSLFSTTIKYISFENIVRNN